MLLGSHSSKHGWKCRFFSLKFCVSGIDDTKEGGEMPKEEISKKFAKNQWKIGWSLKIKEFLKNRRLLQKINNISIFFADFLSIFWENHRLHLLLIRRLPTSSCWSDSPYFRFEFQWLISCASDCPNWSWMWSNG